MQLRGRCGVGPARAALRISSSPRRWRIWACSWSFGRTAWITALSGGIGGGGAAATQRSISRCGTATAGAPSPREPSTETTKKLTDTIRLDYETFINSAFLVQGKADLFVSQRPAERKRILGEILNLSEYERYAQVARDMARDDRNRRDVARGRIEAINRELEQEDGLRAEVEEIAEILVELRQGLESAIKRRDELNTVVADMQNRRRELSTVQARLAELSQEVEGLTTRRGELQQTRRQRGVDAGAGR